MTYKKSCEKLSEYLCEKCNFKCSKKWQYERHLLTQKHQNTYQYLPKSAKKCYFCECGRDYTHRQSLYNHKKICMYNSDDHKQNNNHSEKNILLTENENKNDIIVKLLNQNNQLQQQVIEIYKNGINNISNSNVNSNNKTFNLQLFLNETCKDAMNITDFVDSLKLQISDLENVGKLGFVDGLSSIIVKSLKQLDITKRPVHCSDSKRDVLYIKDENKWEKENEENIKLKQAIKHIAHKNCKLIPEWKAKNPECVYSNSHKSDEYNKIVLESMGGGPDIDNDCYENKIIKKIAKEVVIDKT